MGDVDHDDATHEKMTSSLNVSRGLVIMTTGGYIGDAPPYQGHVVTMSERTGMIAHVWNSLCGDRHALIVPSSCSSSDSAIWSRNGAAVDPANGTLVVATGNAPWNGKTDWGDSVLVLSPDASELLRHYTPANYQHLNDADVDLGSTSPALLPGGYAVQGGKDGVLRLLQLHSLPGVDGRLGGEVQTLNAPGPTDVFSEPHGGNGKWKSVSDSVLRRCSSRAAASIRSGRTTPAALPALGLRSPLYVAGDGAVHVYVPTSGREVATLPGALHWQSPIVAGRPRRSRRGLRERPLDERRARHLSPAVRRRGAITLGVRLPPGWRVKPPGRAIQQLVDNQCLLTSPIRCTRRPHRP